MKKIWIFFVIFSFLFGSSPQADSSRSVYDFQANLISGEAKNLSDYKGKVLLIVNTASGCGFTPQYAALQGLYEKYKDRGFEILAFPSNNFGGQEPGSNEEIQKFCNLRFKVKFPLFEKVDVKGDSTHPLFKHLTQEGAHKGSIKWNFAKFLIDQNGQVADRFASTTDPLSKKITSKIDFLLNSPAA